MDGEVQDPAVKDWEGAMIRMVCFHKKIIAGLLIILIKV
jgi:hypothetical protein